MASVKLADGAELAYSIDDFTDAWKSANTLLMVHGLAESRESWRAWVPYLARHYEIVRVDLRGYGESTPMADDYTWRFDQVIDDLVAVLDALQVSKAHVVGAKIGGTFGLALAARRPDRVISLAAVGAPASLRSFAERAPTWREQIRREGVAAWAQATMEGRLGTGLPKEAVDWWIDLMSHTAPSTLEGFLQMVPSVDVTPELPQVRCPTLVITTTGSGLGSVDAVRAWQQTIPNSRLAEVPGGSYHVAASDPDACAELVREFLREQQA